MVIPNYPYNNNVPNPANDPGDDVGDMNQNTKSIQNLIITDHINFGTAGSGAHNRSQYLNINQAANTVPPNLIGSGYATMYCNTNGSLQEELFFTRGASGIAIQLTTGSSTGPSISSTLGSTFLPGNMILNVGLVTMSGSGGQATGNVNFLTAFTTSNYFINATLMGVSAATSIASNTTLSVVPVSVGTFKYIFNYISSGTLAEYPKFYFMAVGQ